MWSFTQPSADAKNAFLDANAGCECSYAAEFSTGRTKGWRFGEREHLRGYQVDHNRCVVGHGRADFELAAQGLAQWAMAPDWAEMRGGQTVGDAVLLQFRLAGLYWLSCGRIVYAVQEKDAAGELVRCGFAYGTLPGHVECGEEQFAVSLAKDGTVLYEIMAFSKPRYWAAKLAKPLARHWQRKFVRESQAALLLYVSRQRLSPSQQVV
jgi:uncharacterized protein (UPF0548 family)